MRNFVLVVLLVISGVAHAKSVSTPKSPVVITDGKLFERLCYYEDKAYTLGSVIKVGEIYLICQKEQEFELNGDLRWLQLDQGG
ncbi:conserved hypothetical protein [Vibrio nigripulchritudo MADA3029]|uniref:DUF1496 domain-containing protein n=2 Tax=Vibrio nigripulchritudo TaxID=28173 RepID=U4KCL9_9VIBR|nr:MULTISPECIES: YnjH family protein [Vibrio]EGU61554.1 hypothetical protein VINI7043_00487 [Vibrio nigripulchritudo ATCC 27043]KJY67921.1 hypothetical protein TW74_26705 [Vibrio nigripulchritudo]UAB74010.1 YnjH family protein [Vibrio sp. SCSIO 43132]CCN34381.1 conserved hypothetical protein [Vibrio nigripulchritudo AM115]CCN39148.1 conserved hypothetical protein [Vibrio nigripulchritudo FTn2]